MHRGHARHQWYGIQTLQGVSFPVTIVLYSKKEVSEIILAKVSKLYELSRHSRGFLPRLEIFKTIGLNLLISLRGGGGTGFCLLFHFRPYFTCGSFLCYFLIYFDETEPKVSKLQPNVCDFQEETHILGYGFKNVSNL
jgi:hypothetical protein